MSLPPDHHRMQTGYLPTPFSADQIRDACRPGRSGTYRVEVDGEEPYLQVTTFVDGDDESCVIEFTRTTIDGVALGEPAQVTSTWTELQAHASYAESEASIGEESIDTPAGRFDCWRYTVTEEGAVTTAWFATGLPGAPVDYRTEIDDRVVNRMTLISVVRPPD